MIQPIRNIETQIERVVTYLCTRNKLRFHLQESNIISIFQSKRDVPGVGPHLNIEANVMRMEMQFYYHIVSVIPIVKCNCFSSNLIQVILNRR